MKCCSPANATRGEGSAYPQRPRLLAALAAAQSVATPDVAAQAQAQGLGGPRIGEMIHKARVKAVEALLAAKMDAGSSPA